MPEVADPAGVLFSSTGEFMGGNVRLPLEYVVTVRPRAYLALGAPDRHGVARLVGAVNRALHERLGGFEFLSWTRNGDVANVWIEE